MTEKAEETSVGVKEGERPFQYRIRLPLFLVLLAVVLAVSLSPLSFFSVLTFRQMRETLVTAQQERQLQQAATLATRVDAFLEQEGREAVRLGEALGTLADPGRDEVAPVLANIIDDSVILARFQPLAGPPVSVAAKGAAGEKRIEETLARDAQSLFGPNNSGAAALLSGPFRVGSPMILAVTVTAPVARRGDALGVFQQVALFQGVWEELEAAVPPPSRMFLLSPAGELVAQTEPEERLLSTSLKGRAIVQQFLSSRGRSRGSSAYEVPGESGEPGRRLGSYAATAHGWGIFVEVDEAIALAPINRILRDSMIGAALAAGLAMVAAFLLGGMISRPMARLAAISRRLAGGDFSVEAPPSRVREITELAGNFNWMAARLGELVMKFRTVAREANAMFLGTIRALAEAIDEKDPYTKGHSIRVNQFAVIIGRQMGLSREELRALHVSSLLHDVGKIGIDDAILKKPAALTPEEFETMKTHTERGAKIMGRIPQMAAIIPGMRFHHERWSGAGYPLGLREEEIPLQARIIAVADTFDAMTTDRPYKKGFPVAEAVDRINDLKGTHLDAQSVEAFNRAYKAGEFDGIFPSGSEGAVEESPASQKGNTGEAAGSRAVTET